MQQSTINSLRSLAPDLLKGKFPYPSPAYAQHAISILKILKDGEWHTSKEISEELEIGQKYVKDILRACKNPWCLASHRYKGWMLTKPELVIIA